MSIDGPPLNDPFPLFFFSPEQEMHRPVVLLLAVLTLAVALASASPYRYTMTNGETLTSRDLQKLKWWKDVKPSRLKSRWETERDSLASCY